MVSLRGREHPLLQRAGRLGPWPIRRFSGAFDDGGAVWTRGELLVESVRRIKGQAAQAVVLTECDFEDLSPMTRRLLFVGMTRARMHLERVLTHRASAAVARALGVAAGA